MYLHAVPFKELYSLFSRLRSNLKTSSRVGSDDPHSMRACPELGFSVDQEMMMACARLDYRS